LTTSILPAPAGELSFADLGLPPRFLSVLAESGITTPFPVQTAAIPDLMAGRDVIGRAPTGSGKTLAFGLPMLARVGRSDPMKPKALVLAPTRELAAQIQKELTPIAKVQKRFILAVYGGVGYDPQKRALRKGIDVLVACPGRLRDLINQRAVSLSAVELVVIDEADRMADMGFLPDVKSILDMTPKTRQTVLFSATLDGAVGQLVRDYQIDPVRHDVAGVDVDITDMEHRFIAVEAGTRVGQAGDLIESYGSSIVFCRTRRGADRVAEQLDRNGVRAASIHGGLSQRARDRALAEFKQGRVQALIATDVAARGIHVDGVACVVHYDPPEDANTYVHRSGRTARAGATGVVVSLLERSQLRTARKMQQDLGLALKIEGASDVLPEEPRKSGPPARSRNRGRTGGNQSYAGDRPRVDRPHGDRPHTASQGQKRSTKRG
jgi:superfamily II DNA/RNA helicase